MGILELNKDTTLQINDYFIHYIYVLYIYTHT